MSNTQDPCNNDPALYRDQRLYRRSLLTLYYQILDLLMGTNKLPSRQQLDLVVRDDYLFRRTLIELSCAGVNYIVEGGTLYTETDPTFKAWLDSSPNISTFTNNVNYLTTTTLAAALIETDPLFSASAAAAIVLSDITHWNSAYSWGNHALAGYITAETDPIFTAWLLATPPIFAETDPAFAAWLLATPPLYPSHLTDFVHGDIAHANRAALNLVSGTNTGDQDLKGLIKFTYFS